MNGVRWPLFSSASTSDAQPPVPTTSTRRLAMLRTTCSQAAERRNTATAASARPAARRSRSGTQRSSAEIATSPVIVPTAEATAGPSVKYALSAVRSPIVQTADTTVVAKTARIGERLWMKRK